MGCRSMLRMVVMMNLRKRGRPPGSESGDAC
jgi:hypothetical protein